MKNLRTLVIAAALCCALPTLAFAQTPPPKPDVIQDIQQDFQTMAGVTSALLVLVVPVAIASLPTCNSTLSGSFATVNNGVASPTYNGAVSTTGTATDHVFCSYNGSTYGWVYQ